MSRVVYVFLAFAVLGMFLPTVAEIPESSRSKSVVAKHTKKLETDLTAAGLTMGNPIFFRITKTQNLDDKQGKLEAFVKNSSDEFTHFKTWDICYYSGELGPKLKQGDGQSPEGFYFVKPNQLNPYSSYYLSFNLGYPNAYDRAHKRTGNYLMVHGDCVSIGCYAMTDEGIEEIYTLINAALNGGQPFVRVHIFPFPMTDKNLGAFKDNANHTFWENLKEGWDWFEENKQPPNVDVLNKRYVFSQAQ